MPKADKARLALDPAKMTLGVSHPCTECTGKIINPHCLTCGGRGVLELKIPMGALVAIVIEQMVAIKEKATRQGNGE